MPALLRFLARVCFVVAWSAAACSPRAMPDRFPTASALSVEAPESAPPFAAVALREDPPMSGEASSAWQGLSPTESPAPDPHAHHHGMTHGAAPPPTPAPAAADAGAPAPSPHEGHHHAQ